MSGRTAGEPAGEGADGEGPVETIELLARLAEEMGVAFRLSLMDPEGPTDVLHDGLGEDVADEVERHRLPLSRQREALLEVPTGQRAGELVAAVAGRLLRLEVESRLFARELADRYEELSLLTSMGETLASVLEMDRAAEKLLAELVGVTGAARATLWLHEPGGEHLRLLASRGVSDPAVRRVGVGDENSLVAAVFRRQEPALVESDPDGGGRWPGYRGAAVLAVPVSYSPGDEPPRKVGVLALVGRSNGGRFSAGDRELVSAIASQAAAAVENRRLVRDSLRQERLSAELALAHDLQLGLLPDPAIVDELAEAAARCEPARSVGGDFYHLLRLPGRRLGVLLGDVSSHGISAALVMARALSAASIVAREEDAPGVVLSRLEAELRDGLATTEMYVTLFYAVLGSDGGPVRYASAGHPHAFLLGGEGPRRLPALDPPLGLEEPAGSFRERTVEEDAARRPLLLFTDGLFEPAGGRRLEAEGRLVEAAEAARRDGVEAIVEAVFEASARLAGEKGDDRTALAVRLRGRDA